MSPPKNEPYRKMTRPSGLGTAVVGVDGVAFIEAGVELRVDDGRAVGA